MRKLLAIFAFVPAVAFGQSEASQSIGASATVLQQISVSAVQDLEFDKVGQGVNKVVAVDDATSGRFSVKGQGAARYELTLTLPTHLAQAGEDAAELVIDTWTGSYSDESDMPEGTAFTPSNSPETRTLPGDVTDYSQEQFYRIGATVRPTANQAPGDYTAEIQIAVEYLDI